MLVVKIIAVVLAGLVIIALLSATSRSGNSERTRASVKGLAQASGEYCSKASSQKNPMLALMDATLALGYAQALNSMADSNNVRDITGTDPCAIVAQARDIQAEMVRALCAAAPAVTPEGDALLVSEWQAK
jgi:hypothetical protein